MWTPPGRMAGLLVAGVCFILRLPDRHGLCLGLCQIWRASEVTGVLYGVKPVIIALSAGPGEPQPDALNKASRGCCRDGDGTRVSRRERTAALTWGRNRWSDREMAEGIPAPQTRHNRAFGLAAWPFGLLAKSAAATTSGAAFGLWPLFWFFLKVGSILYGSGYVLLHS